MDERLIKLDPSETASGYPVPSGPKTQADLLAENARLRAEVARLQYVLEGVRGAILTGRNEPLMIWKDQIDIALFALRATEGGE